MSGTRTTKREIGVGYSANGQKAVLQGHEDANGERVWALRLEPRTFREQPVVIEGLTARMIQQMADAVRNEP